MQRNLLIASGLALWLIATFFCFYWVFWQNNGLFDPEHRYPNNKIDTSRWLDQIQLWAPETSEPVIIHWLNLNCSCSRYAISYIQQLTKNSLFSSKQLILIPESQRQQVSKLPVLLQPLVKLLKKHDYQQSQSLLPSAPAATIYQNGKISYLGPHSSGGFCGQGRSYIELVLNNLQQGFDSALINIVDQQGCFCRW